MSGLTRKKIKVRGKSGKTFQRSVMVKSESGQLLRRHIKTAAISGFAGGAISGLSGGAAGIGSTLWAHRSEWNTKIWRADRNSDNHKLRTGAVGAAGILAGSAVGAGAAAAVRRQSKHWKAMRSDMKSRPWSGGAFALRAVHAGASVLGWGAGVAGSLGVVHAAVHVKVSRRHKTEGPVESEFTDLARRH